MPRCSAAGIPRRNGGSFAILLPFNHAILASPQDNGICGSRHKASVMVDNYIILLFMHALPYYLSQFSPKYSSPPLVGEEHLVLKPL